jgi:RNA polymerase sigma factor (sigma-70 family)
MHWRAERVRQHFRTRELAVQASDSIYFEAPAIETSERRQEQLEAYARVHAALSRLPTRYQAVLRLRYTEQMKLDDVAGILGKRPGTVKSLIHRGLGRLRRQLEKDATFQGPTNFRDEEI